MYRITSKNVSAHRRSVNARWRRACRGSIFGLLVLFTVFTPYLLIGKSITALHSSYSSTVFFSPFAKSNIQRMAVEKAKQSLQRLGSKFPSKLVKKMEENEELILKSTSNKNELGENKPKDIEVKKDSSQVNSSQNKDSFTDTKLIKSKTDISTSNLNARKEGTNSQSQKEKEKKSKNEVNDENSFKNDLGLSNNVRAVINGSVLKFDPLDVDGSEHFKKNSQKRKERREKRFFRQMKRLTYLTSQDYVEKATLTLSDDDKMSTQSTLKTAAQDDLAEKSQTETENEVNGKSFDLSQMQQESQDQDQDKDEEESQTQSQSQTQNEVGIRDQSVNLRGQNTQLSQTISLVEKSNQINQNQNHDQNKETNDVTVHSQTITHTNADAHINTHANANEHPHAHANTHKDKHEPSHKTKLNSFQKKRNSLLRKYNIWKTEKTSPKENDLLKLLKQQIIMAKGYMAIAQQYHDNGLYKELKQRMRENLKIIGEAVTDTDLPTSAFEGLELMGLLLSKARKKDYDCTTMVKKLRSMVEGAEESNQALKKQSVFLSQLAAKSMPKSLNCFSLQLTIEYYLLPKEERNFPKKENLVDRSLIHYALFSDNVLAAAVVVNSTMMNAIDTSKHVFHVVTDRLNYAAMKMWFFLNPPANATIEVQNYDDFKWLNSSYCPVLRQLESASMKDYYFKASANSGSSTSSSESVSSNLKYRNPKYLSMLNHIRFYLPQMFPDLEKILFLDDDIVVQKDLSPLWQVDLHGMVNGAVETCGRSFHRYDKYLNFSHPLIAATFDPQACGWAFGMNLFDLQMWRQRDMTGIYHKWQNANEDRTLWKLGTLPPGLMTFYNQTFALDKSWHFLGLGYNSNLDMNALQNSAVIHWNGNLKPWLEIAISKFKPFWTKYVNFDDPLLKHCNFNG